MSLTQVDILQPAGTRARCVELRIQGKGVRAIAREVGVSPQAVSQHLQHPEAVEALRKAGDQAVALAAARIRDIAPEITEVARDVARGRKRPNPGQVESIKLLLTLAGLQPAAKLELSGTVTHDLRLLPDDALERELAQLRADTKEVP